MSRQDPGDIVKVMIILFIVFWAFILLGLKLGWFEWLGQGFQTNLNTFKWGGLIIICGLIIYGAGYLIYYIQHKEEIDKRVKEKKERKRREEQVSESGIRRENEILRSIMRDRLVRERADQLEGLDEDQKDYLINKWIEAEEVKKEDIEKLREYRISKD